MLDIPLFGSLRVRRMEVGLLQGQVEDGEALRDVGFQPHGKLCGREPDFGPLPVQA